MNDDILLFDKPYVCRRVVLSFICLTFIIIYDTATTIYHNNWSQLCVSGLRDKKENKFSNSFAYKNKQTEK